MSAKIRPDLESVEALLRKVKGNLDGVDKEKRQRVGAQVRRLNESMEKLPQVSRIRPATIALNNLAVSLRDYDEPSRTLVDELVKPFDKASRPSEIRSAILVCKRCGCT